MTAQSLYSGVMLLDYRVRLPEYLAKCINKERPDLHCEGRCLLMQKIKEKEENEAPKNPTVSDYSVLYVCREPAVLVPYPPDGQICGKPFPYYLTAYAFNHSNSIFRPPIT